MHSPVLINYDPGFIDDYSGWEYETDDYYDGDGPDSEESAQPHGQTPTSQNAASSATPSKRKRADSAHRKRKRRRQNGAERDIPELDLDESGVSEAVVQKLTRPLVVWRGKEAERQVKVPLLKDGEGTRVSVLKDWRERLGFVGAPTGDVSNTTLEDGSMRIKSASRPKRNQVKKDQNTRYSKKRAREDEDIGYDVYSSASDDVEGLIPSLSPKANGANRNNIRGKKNGGEKSSNGIVEGKTLATHARKSKRLKNG